MTFAYIGHNGYRDSLGIFAVMLCISFIWNTRLLSVFPAVSLAFVDSSSLLGQASPANQAAQFTPSRRLGQVSLNPVTLEMEYVDNLSVAVCHRWYGVVCCCKNPKLPVAELVAELRK